MSRLEKQSKLEIAIPYRAVWARIVLFLLLLTAPMWFLVCGLAAVLLGLSMAFMPLSVMSVSTILFLISVLAGGLFLTTACSDDKLFLCKTGLTLPLFMLPWVKFKCSRRWSDLRSVQLKQDSGDAVDRPRGSLWLSFYSGGSARLKLQSMRAEDIEKLLLAFDIWAPHCHKDDKLENLHRRISKSDAASEPSYTQLWEEELRRRFFPTAFVPLEAGARLRDSSLVIVRQLAFGGLSAIYLAQDKQKDLVVVKEAVIPINADENSRAKALEMFAREAKLLARLKHERICQVLDFFVEESRQYLVLEQIKGQDTRQFIIENGPQSEQTVLNWALQIARILHYLHTQSPPIIHRDVTPDNLVLGEGKNIFLIDFGASNEFLGTATGTLVGKQSYIAPEQFRGKASPQSDIYALGASIYYYLTAKEPEPLSTLSLPQELSVSDKTRLLVSRCTAFKLEDRFAAIEDLIQELCPEVSAAGATAEPPK